MTPMSNARGKLRIGDDWNAIRIIALSQSNPLKPNFDSFAVILPTSGAQAVDFA